MVSRGSSAMPLRRGSRLPRSTTRCWRPSRAISMPTSWSASRRRSTAPPPICGTSPCPRCRASRAERSRCRTIARKPTRVDLASLPASFTEDLERYLAWCRVSDVFDPQARVRPLKATTLHLRRQQIISAVTAAVAAGIEPSRLVSLKDLLEPSIFKEILRRRHAMAGGKPNAYTLGVAKTLIAMAREWAKLDPKQIAELKALAAKLPQLPAGLTREEPEAAGLVQRPGQSRALPGSARETLGQGDVGPVIAEARTPAGPGCPPDRAPNAPRLASGEPRAARVRASHQLARRTEAAGTAACFRQPK